MAPLSPLMNWLMRHVMVVITATYTAISFFALIVLYRQNLTAHAAADAANENAKATRASVDGYIKSQRAWIKVMLRPTQSNDVLPGPHEVILKNEGLTPAIIVHYSREVRYQEEPGLFENLPKPQYPPTQFVVEIRVAGGGQISGEDGLEMFYGDYEMPEDFQEEIKRGKRRVVLYGRVHYKDVFTPMLHTTGYGFVYSSRQRRFIQIGRSDYNYLD